MEDLRRELVEYIRRKFHNLAGIRDLAEDMVQDAFAAVHDEQKLNFGYLAMVCVRLCYREYRRQQRQSVDYIDILISEDNVVDEILAAERAEAVLASLDTLREIERQILRLRYYQDCSFAEIARRTGVKLSTVLTTHYRALEKLRPQLSKFIKY